ncbi:hypothetical protein GCM10007977_026650 [Dactylosporangium sucinum]|uniref:Uncharacterized protein n=1 Tax=Dactylosporangium sucinum TaxID=1424081 RepID=A0A917TIJ1_9ACTN|nr:hypothetical protein GCM10007977_026650 [Dactylosporangium sucinum]
MSTPTSRLFGGRTEIAIIVARAGWTNRRRAAVAFWVVTGLVGLLAGVTASSYLPPVAGCLVGALVGAACGVVAFALVAAWPVLRALWHWLPELVLSALLLWGWTALMDAANLVVSLLLMGVVVGVPAAVRPLRRQVVGWLWCLVVRHRLRMCLAAFVKTRGRNTLPLIGWARPTPAGEQVWVWLRGGLSLKTFEDEGQVQSLAVECWASEVRVARASARNAALVRFDVTRRDPLRHTRWPRQCRYLPSEFECDAPVSPSHGGGRSGRPSAIRPGNLGRRSSARVVTGALTPLATPPPQGWRRWMPSSRRRVPGIGPIRRRAGRMPCWCGCRMRRNASSRLPRRRRT